MRGPADLYGFEDENTSITFRSPDIARSWLEEQTFSPRERNRVEARIKRWESELGQKHVERINNLGATIGQEVARHEDRITEGRRETNDILLAVKSGRMTAREAKRKLRGLAERHRDALKTQEMLVRQAEKWDASTEQDPAEAAQSQAERFSALGTPGLTITSAVIRGEVDDE